MPGPFGAGAPEMTPEMTPEMAREMTREMTPGARAV